MAALAESELPHAGRGAALAWRLASDDALARAVTRGNDAAFAALYDRYHAPLLRYCRSMLLGADDAQDAAQNALAAALRALRSPDRATPLRLKPWLYRIAHNEALAVIRRRPTHIALDDEAAAVVAPDHGASRAALRELVDDLRTLPDRQRSALVLRELEGLSYTEVGAALQMSGEAARTAVFEARSALWAQRTGRDSACDDVRLRLSEGDGRTARARDLRAHLDTCDGCDAFAEQIRARRRSLRALFPLPGLVAASSGSGWALFGGGAVATKCAALCATAVVVGGSVAALETTHRQRKAITSATAGPTPTLAPPRITDAGARSRQDAALVVPTRAAARTRAPARPRTVMRATPVVRVTAVKTRRVNISAPVVKRAPARSSAPAAPAPSPEPTQTTPAPAPTATTATVQEHIKAAVTTTQDRLREAVTDLATRTQAALSDAAANLAALRDRVKAALSGNPQ
ncbi:MAG TPA: RNA polymerase sigma factor [Solirubrobacteraceae bacterium]